MLQFTKSFALDYHFTEKQHLKVAVFHADRSSGDLAQHSHIGDSEFTLAELIASGQTLVKNLCTPGTF